MKKHGPKLVRTGQLIRRFSLLVYNIKIQILFSRLDGSLTADIVIILREFIFYCQYISDGLRTGVTRRNLILITIGVSKLR